MLDQYTGKIINSIPMYSDKFIFDKDDNIFLLIKSVTSPKLVCYDINGEWLRSIEIFDFKIGNFIFFDKGDNIVVLK